MGIFRRKARAEFRLGDAERRHEENPDSFGIPTRAERESVRPGDLVKLLFDFVEPAEDEWTGERMWVEVNEVRGGRYVGTLDNEPFMLTSVALGSQIEFGPEHIIDVWEDEPTGGEATAMVIRRAYDEGLRPRVARHNEPVDATDSGWRLLVGDETEDELDDPANALLKPLSALTERWPELQALFDAGEIGSDWVWDDASGTYVRDAAGGMRRPGVRADP